MTAIEWVIVIVCLAGAALVILARFYKGDSGGATAVQQAEDIEKTYDALKAKQDQDVRTTVLKMTPKQVTDALNDKKN